MNGIRTAARNPGAGRLMQWTVNGLFRRRLARFWTEQWRVWRTALDWTVWLYLIIPGLWIGAAMYAWQWHHPAEWITHVPLITIERAPFVLVFAGRLRTFAEEADVLFLLQRREWTRGLYLRGMLYTAAALAFVTALAYGLLLPYLSALHQVPPGRVALMALFTAELAFLAAVQRSLVEARYRGFRRYAAKYGCGIALAVLFAAAVVPSGLPELLPGAAAAGLAAALWIGRAKLRARYTFESDVQAEHRARLASTELLLRNVIERRPRIPLGKPAVLRRSKRLFKRFDGGTMLAEAALKTFVRRYALLRIWLQYTAVAAIAVALTPFALKLALIVVLPVLLSLWAQSHWRSFAGEPFIAQFSWTDEDRKRSAELTRLWMIAPGVLLLAVIAGLQRYGVWGLPLAVPSLAVWYGINKIMSDILLLRNHREGRKPS
ncbi:ABC transporter permease [Paenibacillus humicola]|uniref:ABC transporter permease n=1 Tax=Paenibacillus humicola TaxID=3110540 RepID=UPI00237BCF62|nr:ABC transporter permease [Paenibacillus humicola]